MTPKEKSKELHLRFLLKLPLHKEVITENEHGKWSYDSEQLAKEHCLICVDEIIEVMGNVYHSNDAAPFYDDNYWQSVKKEIEKL